MSQSIFATPEFWVNVLSAISVVLFLPELQALLGPVLGPKLVNIIAILTAVVNVLLRFIPKPSTPVTLFGGAVKS